MTSRLDITAIEVSATPEDLNPTGQRVRPLPLPVYEDAG
jgi:hypothetical protein